MGRSTPITAAHVESEIMRLCERMEEVTEDLAEQAEEAGVAEATYRCAYAKVVLETEGTITIREHRAQLRTHKLLLNRKIAEAKYAASKEVLATIRSQVSALQTISSSVRSQT